MIYIVTTHKERNENLSEKSWKELKETFGNNIKLIYADTDDLSILADEDIILAETRDDKYTHIIRNLGVKHTMELPKVNILAQDKEVVKPILESIGVPYPKTIDLDKVVDGGKYFVKPLHGMDSIGVDENSLCTTKEEVKKQIEKIIELGDIALIEEFIDGIDCTVGIFNIHGEGIQAYPISIKANMQTRGNIYTHEAKYAFDEECKKFDHPLIKDYAIKAFKAIGGQKYMRIDFRVKENGDAYLIDINQLPGLGNNDHLSLCCKEWFGASHKETIETILKTATYG